MYKSISQQTLEEFTVLYFLMIPCMQVRNCIVHCYALLPINLLSAPAWLSLGRSQVVGGGAFGGRVGGGGAEARPDPAIYIYIHMYIF